ncbi:MAG: sucrase ferredoxin [Polyangiales bacterium]
MTPADCSVASLEVGESLAGTAVESVDRWLLLELNDTWAPDALQSEALHSVRVRLADWLQSPRSRLQLIRRPGRSGKRPLFMVVDAGDKQRTSTVQLERYEDLLDVELDALPSEPSTPICLVCVHGRRDRCCALHGSAVFRAIHSHSIDVWQTSHLGGHRFAACALWLPDGLMYGRLRAEHAGAFVASRHAGEIGDLSLFRGRCSYDRPTQAAEILLRSRLGEGVADAIRWVSTVSESESTWDALFQSRAGEHRVRIRIEDTGVLRPASCGAEPEPVTRFTEI